MKFCVLFATIAAVFCQALFAKDPVPLAKATAGNRTNHPVLFVSGLGSNASGTWGAKGKQLYCENPELRTDAPPKVTSFDWYVPRKTPLIGYGLFTARISYPYNCSNISGTFYGGEVPLQPEIIVYKTSWKGTPPSKDDFKLTMQFLPEGRYPQGYWLAKSGIDRIWPEMDFESLLDLSLGAKDDSTKAKILYEYLFCQNAMNPLKGALNPTDISTCTNTFVSIDSLYERSQSIVAAQSDSMSSWHPEGDWEQTFDYPTSYKEDGLAYAFAEAFGLPRKNMDENFSKVTNGLYFFNPKSRCRASSNDNIGADCDSLDDWANPRWDTTFENYGQPNQLLDKMVRSLDDFYGKDAWHDDTNAVIDIVAHSQGGLTTRIAIDKSRSQDGRNPVNHINRIVAISTPHIGSALATSSRWLDKGNPDDNNAKYPQLAKLKNWLLSKDSTISLKGSMYLTLNGVWDWIGSVKLSVDVHGPAFGPYQIGYETNTKLFKYAHAENIPFSDYDDKNEREELSMSGLWDAVRGSGHLAWPVESNYMHNLDTMRDPTYPRNGKNIHVTHFYSRGLSNHFLETFKEHLKELLRKTCVEMLNDSDKDDRVRKGKSCRDLVKDVDSGKFGDSWINLQERFRILDTDWPWRSDLVVENSSQMGLHAETGYDPRRNAEFRPKTFRWNSSTTIHGALPEALSDIVKSMGLAAATQQKCDILSELGVPISSFEGECDYPTSLEQQAGVRNEGGVAKISLKSSANTAKSSISSFDYYFVAEPGKALDVQTSGADASVKVEHVGGAIHKATITLAQPAPAEGDWPANGEFSLSIQYADGTPRDASNDPSMPVSDGIALSIPVFDETGRRVGGLVPQLDTLDQDVASLYTISVEAKERSGMNTITQPSVRIRNEGDLALHGFKMRYTVTSVRKPELRVYWIDRMPNATWKLVELGDHRWAVEFDYAGLDLKKGESVSPIDFELFNPDWSPWNRDDDHSALGVGNEWAVAPFVEVFLPDGGRLWGLSPEMIERDTTEAETPRTSLKVVGREESDLYNKSTHRLRVVNDGDVPVEGFVVYDYFTSEGQEPLFDAWDVPRCAVSKEHLGGLEWRLVYDCSNVVLDPGQEADWAEWGMLVDRHYPDWSTWDASNDWSALTSEWAEATRVRVVAKDGTPLWGEAPALAAPAPASFAMGLPGPLGPEFLPPL